MMKSPNGYPIQSPYVSIASKQAEIMIRIAAEFGFTPASRMRLPSQSKDPLLLELRSIEELASELKPLE
jgi:phage terminase small subunit